jgi:Flp pilus assembly protein TadG
MRIRFESALRNFAKNISGVAAIEFAFVAPLMAAALVLTFDVGMLTIQRTDMQSAVRAGAQYLMDGGRDMDRMSAIVNASWSSKPAGSSVSGVRNCMCSDAAHACTSLCSDDSVPESYINVVAAGTLDGILRDTTLQVTEAVRVR